MMIPDVQVTIGEYEFTLHGDTAAHMRYEKLTGQGATQWVQNVAAEGRLPTLTSVVQMLWCLIQKHHRKDKWTVPGLGNIIRPGDVFKDGGLAESVMEAVMASFPKEGDIEESEGDSDDPVPLDGQGQAGQTSDTSNDQ